MSPSATAAWPVRAAGAAPCTPGPAAKGPQVLWGPLGGQSEAGEGGGNHSWSGGGERCPRPAPFLQPPWCPLPGDSVTCRSGSSSHSPAPAYPAQQRSRLSRERELHWR